MRSPRMILAVFIAAAASAAALAAVPASAVPSGASPAGASPSTVRHYSGTLADGSAWEADVPSDWNGTLLLYSHGFGTLTVADSPDPATAAALLARGYALAGSSYDPDGSLWALDTAVSDQFGALRAARARALPARPSQVIAFGTSMGGLISALEAQDGAGRIDGALTTCGLVAGGVNLNNYQLDGEYALARLLLPGQNVNLVPDTTTDALATAGTLTTAAATAQQTAAGRARLALAMAFINVPPWASGQPGPAVTPAAQEAAQYQVEFPGSFSTLDFIEAGRPAIEQADGGNASWTRGVNFAAALNRSPYLGEVAALYRAAGLSLGADLANLTAHADITANPSALRSLEQTSVPDGRLEVPELDLHTISDQLAPVQFENYYAHQVDRAGSGALLRQAYVASVGHCDFSSAELVAGVLAIGQRVSSGHWGTLADPANLNRVALSLRLGAAQFAAYQPGPLTGATRN